VIGFVLVIVCLYAPSLSQIKNSTDDLLESAKYEREDYQGAVADYTKAIKLKPDYAEIYDTRGNAKGRLKDYQRAIADYAKAISLMPDYAEAYSHRGIAYLGLGLRNNAMADFMKVKELGSRVPQELLDMCQ
jgi:tetratricopeptide (TPR) repeat protein